MQDTPIEYCKDINIINTLAGADVQPARVHHGGKYPVDRKTGEKIKYVDLVSSFDIETSKEEINGDMQGFMYVWFWQFGDIVTVYGRTWDEFKAFCADVNAFLFGCGCRMLVYVHRLDFEFQFLSGIWDFAEEDVFATAERKPLWCRMLQIEFRCSYRLSNYNLDEWANKLMTQHRKLTGALDYNVIRYPWTELTDEELQYCRNDVICVVECVLQMLSDYNDTLYSIPYTATGYIRRRVKAAMRTWSPRGILSMQNSLEVYDMLRAAFRGGDTHANKRWIGAIKGDVNSYDISSSYPAVMCHCKFPMSKFRREEDTTFENMQRCLSRGRALLLKACFHDIRLKSISTGDPYIPLDKCIERGLSHPRRVVSDNGRIVAAEYCEITITDIDLEVICMQYDFSGMDIIEMLSSRYGYLPQPIADILIDLYRRKTALKGVPGKELEYLHCKIDLNSCFGMMAQRVITNPVVFRRGEWHTLENNEFDRDSAYYEAIDRAFLNYAWGVWVTAWARLRLHQGILAACPNMIDFVYADTDSIKCTSNPDFGKFNAERIKEAKRSGAYATDSAGNVHFMGCFEYEWTRLFKALKSKCYITMTDAGDVVVTVSGIPKEKGSIKITEDGGIENFDFDYVFKGIGLKGIIPNDHVLIDTVRQGHALRITRNYCIVEREFRLRIESDYSELVRQFREFLDSKEYSDYNG